jgi:hypothetical protein
MQEGAAHSSPESFVKQAEEGLLKISELTEATKNSSSIASESQKLAELALANIQGKLEEVTTAATQAIAAKTKITDDQAVIATKSDHIQKAQEHADEVRANLDRALTSATQQVTAAEAQQVKATAAAEGAAKALSNIRAAKAAIDTESTAITAARETAETSAAVSKGLADKSTTIEARVTAYENRLKELENKCASQLKTIEMLLPGATSAGLAYSFDERRKSFLKPHDLWQKVFVFSVAVIVLLAITGLWQVYHSGKAPSYDELVRLWLSRLPVVGALVWLALHASREAALAKRLEEDYGYKSAVASCLEGFRKQMSEVGANINPDSPLAKLLDNTLTTIALPPGRIYDKHKLVVSPTEEITAVAKTASNLIGAKATGA